MGGGGQHPTLLHPLSLLVLRFLWIVALGVVGEELTAASRFCDPDLLLAGDAVAGFGGRVIVASAVAVSSESPSTSATKVSGLTSGRGPRRVRMAPLVLQIVQAPSSRGSVNRALQERH